MNFVKPRRLNVGDTVAVVSPSWGGPSVYPHIYENGLSVLRSLGLKVKEYPTARADDHFLAVNPRARAADINDSFADPEVNAIFASIGGDDAIRILPFLDQQVIKSNPKIFMGFSDTTTLLTFINQLGLVTFNGPSVMAGFSQAMALPDRFLQHIKEILFSPEDEYEYISFGVYCDGYLDWRNVENTGKTRALNPDGGWRFIQGSGVVTGKLFGGCIEVLEVVNGTPFWPNKEFWQEKVLFFETSEEKPSIQRVRRMLRNYGMQGILDQVSAVLFGRARDYSDSEKLEFDQMVIDVINGEFGKGTLPLITNMDFGHTDPQFILPLGVRAEIDCHKKSFTLVEPAVGKA